MVVGFTTTCAISAYHHYSPLAEDDFTILNSSDNDYIGE
jgi:hypothetical protein